MQTLAHEIDKCHDLGLAKTESDKAVVECRAALKHLQAQLQAQLEETKLKVCVICLSMGCVCPSHDMSIV